ncbi:MAG: 16S rRNA (cytidine(1402)-2'-O)-methyltransferase [Alphaproteobacteria bacterium]
MTKRASTKGNALKGRSSIAKSPLKIKGLESAETSPRRGLSKPKAPPSPGLYLVATPIGNSRDITLRALDILSGADVIVCEDTRVTSKLLAIHGIRKPLLAYHEHNAERVRPALIQRLKDGEIVAQVSDAGTPMISDPGFRLLGCCVENDIAVTHLPGASSVLMALVLSGLPTDQFLFAGFPATKQGKRRTGFENLKSVPATLVFLESPKRLAKSLADMAHVFGTRDAAIGRELTKMFEEVRRGSLDELAAHYAEAGSPKGEVTVVVAAPDSTAEAVSDAELDALLIDALKTDSVRDAAARVAAQTGLPKRAVYKRALDLSK